MSAAGANNNHTSRASRQAGRLRSQQLATWMLVNKLTDCDGEATETQVWLDFALDCLFQDNRDRLTAAYEEVGKMG